MIVSHSVGMRINFPRFITLSNDREISHHYEIGRERDKLMQILPRPENKKVQ